MGNIYKCGKIWYYDLRVKGHRVRKRIGKSKEVAVLALKEAEVKAARDEFGFSKNDISIDKFLVKFLDYSGAHHSINTTKRYRAVIDNFKAFLSQYPEIVFLSQITPELVDRYVVFRKDTWINPNGSPVNGDKEITIHTRKGARAKTINFELDTIKTIFNIAIKWEYLKDNPTRSVNPIKVTDAKPIRFLSPTECERLLQASPPELQPIYFTFLHTGMRKGELEHLEWSDIDLSRKKIIIRHKEDWHPKTGEREIPISQRLLELLKRLKKENDSGLKSRYVFPHRDGGILKTKLREKLIVIAQKAGIKDLTTLHALRHTFASQLVMKGVDLPTVQKLMGHSDIQTTMIYSHLAPDHLAAAVDKLEY
jgi:integrase